MAPEDRYFVRLDLAGWTIDRKITSIRLASRRAASWCGSSSNGMPGFGAHILHLRWLPTLIRKLSHHVSSWTFVGTSSLGRYVHNGRGRSHLPNCARWYPIALFLSGRSYSKHTRTACNDWVCTTLGAIISPLNFFNTPQFELNHP